ncbi:hypothetical protein BC832DRAFT_596333 [Gaertneriomyces semiglobifer]|nr:hypothetical protein BC832DRAFT_596333 [Gaertneriomyces semiglobifer]
MSLSVAHLRKYLLQSGTTFNIRQWIESLLTLVEGYHSFLAQSKDIRFVQFTQALKAVKEDDYFEEFKRSLSRDEYLDWVQAIHSFEMVLKDHFRTVYESLTRQETFIKAGFKGGEAVIGHNFLCNGFFFARAVMRRAK